MDELFVFRSWLCAPATINYPTPYSIIGSYTQFGFVRNFIFFFSFSNLPLNTNTLNTRNKRVEIGSANEWKAVNGRYWKQTVNIRCVYLATENEIHFGNVFLFFFFLFRFPFQPLILRLVPISLSAQHEFALSVCVYIGFDHNDLFILIYWFYSYSLFNGFD